MTKSAQIMNSKNLHVDLSRHSSWSWAGIRGFFYFLRMLVEYMKKNESFVM